MRFKILKSGEKAFYVGRKKATHEEKKQFFREHPIQVGLSKEDKSLLNKIKAGKARAAKVDQRIGGKFIPAKYGMAAKRAGLKLDVIVKDFGAKNLDDLFKKKPEIKEAIDNVLSGAGLPSWYNPDKAIDVIKGFEGKKIIVNGIEVSKSKAVAQLKKTSSAIKRKFDTVEQGVKLTFKNGEMEITLPSNIDDYTEEEEAEFREDWGEHFEIYTSSPKKK